MGRRPRRIGVIVALTIVAAGLLGVAGAARLSAINLAPDPDFESDPSSAYFTNGPCSFSWSTEQARSPSHSLKIASTTNTLCRWLSNTGSIAATPGTTYNASVYVKTQGVASAGGVKLALLFYAGSTFTGSATESSNLNGTNDWTQESVQVVAPAGTTSARLEVRMNGPGTVYADDIFLSSSTGNPPAPPGVTIVSTVPGTVGASGSSTITWNGTANGAFSVRKNSSTCSDGTQLASGTYSTSPSNTTSNVNAADLATGSNTIRVCLTDGNGNTGSATTTITKDLNMPVVTIVSAVPSTVNAAGSSTLTWHASKNGTFSVRVGGTNCATGTQIDSGAYSTSPSDRTTNVAGASLFEGANTVRVCLTDAVSNEGSATTTINKDTVAPAVTVVSAVPSTVDGAPSSTVTWNATENGAFTVRKSSTNCSDGTQLGTGSYTSAPNNTTSVVNSSDLTVGSNTIRVCVTDAGGNTGSATVTIQKLSSGGGGGTNLAPDPDFEQNPAPFYFSNGPCTFSWSTEQAHSPTHSLKIASTSSSLCRWLSNTTGTPATAGTTYFASAYFKTVGIGVSGATAIAINFYNSSGTYLGVTYQSSDNQTGTTDWTLRSVHGQAPAGTAFIRVEFRLTGAGSLYADDVSISTTAAAVNQPPSFDLPASPNQAVAANAGAQSVPSFATNISPGPPSESGQTVSFLVTNDNNALFTAQPAISPTGTLTYTPDASRTGSATVTVRAMDNGGTAGGGNDTSAPKTFTITTSTGNAAPVLDNIEASVLGYTENDPATVITSALTVSDADSANLAGATVSITSGLNAGDVLALNSPPAGITVTAFSGGVLTLTGSASVNSYRDALRAVTYSNTSDNPSTATRTVSFRVDDGAATNHLSNIVTRQISVAAVNDAPALAGIEAATLSYTQNEAAKQITSSLTVADVDSPNLAGATVAITSGFNAEDVLALSSPPAGITVVGYSGGVLTLTGSATPAAYRDALRGVTYFNSTTSSTATRTVSFQVDDGAAANHLSNVVTRDIHIGAANSAPTNISLSSSSVAEHQPAGTTVGTLTTTDPDAGDAHTYTLIASSASCPGTNTTSDFQIGSGADADKLQTARVFDFATDPTSFLVCVRSTDNGSPPAQFDKQFTITITNANDAPTDITLTASSLAENQPVGTTIGMLSATDPDAGQTHSFTLESSGCGGSFPDNSSFSVSGNALSSAAIFNFEVKSSYTICLRATDNGLPAMSFDKQFTITVIDANDAPVAVDDSYTGAIGNTLAVVQTTGVGPHVALTGNVLTANDTDPDTTFPHTVSAVAETVTSAGGGTATIHTDGSFTFLPGPGDKNQDDTFTYHVTDGSLSSAGTATVHIDNFLVWYVNNALGSNGDGRSSSPFTDLGSLNGAGGSGDSDGPGDFIFLYQGSGNYDGGLPLESDQSLYGEKHGLVVNGHSLVSAGSTAPVITNGSGAGVRLANDVDIEGLDITGTNGVGLFGSAVSSATVGTSTAVNISNAGTDCVNISGAASGDISIASPISGCGGHSVVVSNRTGGTTSFSGSVADSGRGIILNGNTGATVNFTGGVSVSTGTDAAFTAAGGGTVNVMGAGNTLATTGATALNVTGTTIGSSGLTFRSISASGAASGIILVGTGSAGGLTVTGTGSSGTGGTIQNMTGPGISLASTASPSFTNVTILNTAGSGINGTLVTNFSFVDGTINNSGTGGAANDSNISFNDSSTDANVSGQLTVTGSTLANARYHGIDIQNSSGTLSDVTISGNTFASDTSVANSLGSAVRLIALGSSSAVASVTKATLANNVITNFPSGAGFVVQGGNAADISGAPAGTMGQAGSATNVIAITGNRMDGGLGGIGNQPDRFVTALVNGRGQGNFDISNNGTAANPIAHIDGVVIELSEFGDASVTSTISGNRIAANNAVGSAGIGVGCDADSLTTTSENGTLTSTISGNIVSLTDGPGIFAIARNSNCALTTRIVNNTVAAPATTSAARAGIRVDSGSSVGDTTLCLEISGNTTAGSTNTGTATTSPGINLRKQGTSATVNVFGIEGLSPSPTGTPTVENFVNSQNTSTLGTFGVGGTALLSATSGFTNCSAP